MLCRSFNDEDIMHQDPTHEGTSTTTPPQTPRNESSVSTTTVTQVCEPHGEKVVDAAPLEPTSPVLPTGSFDQAEEWEEQEVEESVGGEQIESAHSPVTRVRRRKRQVRSDAVELRLLGRRALCKHITDIAP